MKHTTEWCSLKFRERAFYQFYWECHWEEFLNETPRSLLFVSYSIQLEYRSELELKWEELRFENTPSPVYHPCLLHNCLYNKYSTRCKDSLFMESLECNTWQWHYRDKCISHGTTVDIPLALIEYFTASLVISNGKFRLSCCGLHCFWWTGFCFLGEYWKWFRRINSSKLIFY